MKLIQLNFRTVKSTNDIAMKIIKNTKRKSGLIVSENQTNGRGQYGKKWISYKGNLFVSIFFQIDKINLSLKRITKINCLLIKKLLSFYYNRKITIKYPNDLLINKKKISGILQEILTKSNKKFIIIGIGINLIKSPKIKKYPTTNLYELNRVKINKKEIIAKLKMIFENYIPKFNKINIRDI